jgi:hypothetical protein
MHMLTKAAAMLGSSCATTDRRRPRWNLLPAFLAAAFAGMVCSSVAVWAQDELFVTAAGPGPGPGGFAIIVHFRAANGDVVPLRTLMGPNTGLNSPQGLAVDIVNDEMVVANAGNKSVTVYARTASGDTAPLRTLIGHFTALNNAACLAVDAVNDELFVLEPDFGAVLVHARTASGDTSPIRILSGFNTGLESSSCLVVDTVNDELVVANAFNSLNGVSVFARTAQGDTAPLRTLGGAQALVFTPSDVAVDTVNNELVVVSAGRIVVHSRTASGNVPPLRTLEGPNTGLFGARRVVVDTVHDELFVLTTSGSVRVFARTASGNTPPIRILTGPNTGIVNPSALALRIGTTTVHTDRTSFLGTAGQVTTINFDQDACGNTITVPSGGLLAGDIYSPVGVTFAAGVVFPDPSATSRPNIISHTQINTPTPARVDATFVSPVNAVGINNAGAGAILRAFDVNDALIVSAKTDTDPATSDFLGITSPTPIHRFEYDFVSGLGFGGDDLVFTQIQTPDCAAPVLSVPDTLTVDATGPAGAVVSYSVTATDDVDPNPAVSCVPPSGSTFPIGTTTVICTATDASGKSSSANFQVVVQGASDQITELIEMVSGLKRGLATSLTAKLQDALEAISGGDLNSACGSLAAFVNQVQAQAGKQLTVPQADQLIEEANQIRAVLGCP